MLGKLNQAIKAWSIQTGNYLHSPNLRRTDGRTDGRTDRRSDIVIYRATISAKHLNPIFQSHWNHWLKASQKFGPPWFLQHRASRMKSLHQNFSYKLKLNGRSQNTNAILHKGSQNSVELWSQSLLVNDNFVQSKLTLTLPNFFIFACSLSISSKNHENFQEKQNLWSFLWYEVKWKTSIFFGSRRTFCRIHFSKLLYN